MNSTITTAHRLIRKATYPLTADIADANRRHADEAIAFFTSWGYSSSSSVNVEQHHDGLGRLVTVTGHDNGATVVLVNPLATTPVMVVDRVEGSVAPWGYVWEDDLV